MAQRPPTLYVGDGSEISWYSMDVEAAEVAKQGSLRLPGNVGYAWPHPSRQFLYVATNRRGEGDGEGLAHINALRIDPATGALSIHGAPAPLPIGATHICVDHEGTHVYAAYTRLSRGVTAHRIQADGTIGDEVPQPPDLDVGVFVHQVRVMPSGRSVLLVARGYDPKGDRPEVPGALKLFATNDGVLTNRGSIAPNGGFGFGARHLDFHPTEPWFYVSVERHNQIVMFDVQPDDVIPPAPKYTKNTLSRVRPEGVLQGSGPIHVHPNGRTVYLTNRSDGDGEDNVAVFSIDQTTGEPTLIQHAEQHSRHAATFAIDPSGRMLVAVSARAYGDQLGGITTFRIQDDGRLEFVRKYDMATGGSLSCSGIIAPA
ncbi:MAG: beta-propeller fold lactonase family protein [Dehalococcoidia bacterium]